MKPSLFAAAVAAVTFSCGAAHATTTLIDFNAFTSGEEITGLDLGGVSITQGGGSVLARYIPPLATDIVILGDTTTSDGYRADFATAATTVSVDLGDVAADADDLYLEAYDMFDNLIDFENVSIDQNFIGFETLTVSGSDIAYVVFGGFGLQGNNNVFADNLTFDTGMGAVPLPAGGLLLLGGLGALGLVRRRRRTL